MTENKIKMRKLNAKRKERILKATGNKFAATSAPLTPATAILERVSSVVSVKKYPNASK